LTVWEARFNHAAVAAAAATGVLYGVLKYAVPARDPDSNMAVPWQPAVLKAHVVLAPLVVFGLGLVFRRHALARFRAGEREGRRSGFLLLVIAAPVVFSGYAVQVLTGETATKVVGWGHAATGALFGAVWLAHRFKRTTRARFVEEAAAEGPAG
jgi:hypothetical protein